MKDSEEYTMNFALIAIASLLLLALIFSGVRARKATKPEFQKLYK